MRFDVKEIGDVVCKTTLNILLVRRARVIKSNDKDSIIAHNNLCKTLITYMTSNNTRFVGSDLKTFVLHALAKENAVVFSRLLTAIANYVLSQTEPAHYLNKEEIYGDYARFLVSVLSVDGLGKDYMSRTENIVNVILDNDYHLLFLSLPHAVYSDDFGRLDECLIDSK